MKIFNAQQIKEIDQATIRNEPITSIELMERAAYTCFLNLDDSLPDYDTPIHVFCGMGNNGGDGLAIARFLFEEDYEVNTYLVHFSERMSEDFITNYKRAEEIGLQPQSIYSIEDFPTLEKDNYVVDAIFGTGINRAVSGFTKDLIHHINNSSANVYAIDTPSGLFIDKANTKGDAIVEADEVLTFQFPKLAFLLPDNERFVKHFLIISIGLDRATIESLETNYFFSDVEMMGNLLLDRSKFSHKGSYGHALLIGGSFGKIGATVLASKAALRIGSGLVTAYVPKCGCQIMQTSIPEVMVEVDAENEVAFFNFKVKPSVVGMGMGLGTSDKTQKGMLEFLKRNDIPLVMDADALNILSLNKEHLGLLQKNTVLTPHPKELERLLGPWHDDYEKLEKTKAFSLKYGCIVVVKGAHTAVVHNEKIYFNASGNSGLATAGAGDVLTGLITGLIAQSYEPIDAARLAVLLHGMTADLFSVDKAAETFIASDIISLLPSVFHIVREIRDGEELFDEEGIDYDFYDDYFDDDEEDMPF